MSACHLKVCSQAGVVGLSCRSDVAEMLEKRVKSRFSYRRQLVLNPSTSDFKHPEEGPCALLQALLTLPADSKTAPDPFLLSFNAAVRMALGSEMFRTRLQRLCDLGEWLPITEALDNSQARASV